MTAPQPLPRSTFLILLALADQPRHGLGIIDDIAERTAGDVRMGPGTLYGTLQWLLDGGLIRETAEAPDPDDDDPDDVARVRLRPGTGVITSKGHPGSSWT